MLFLFKIILSYYVDVAKLILYVGNTFSLLFVAWDFFLLLHKVAYLGINININLYMAKKIEHVFLQLYIKLFFFLIGELNYKDWPQFLDLVFGNIILLRR
jgi:hypothetical protein